MYKFGFLVDSVGPFQQSVVMIQQMNEMLRKEIDFSPYIFYRNYDKTLISPLFAIMSIYDAWSFDGIGIATDFHSAKILLECPSTTKKFFYVWNMEWTYDFRLHEECEQIYLNDEIELICRSDYHHSILSRVWKTPKYTIEEFNHEKFTEFIKRES